MNTWNELKYNVSGESRKRMVGIIGQLTGEKAVYLRTPTCSYDIGPFNVGRHGELTWAEDTKPNTINLVIAGLSEQGFVAEDMGKKAKTADKPKEKKVAKTEPPVRAQERKKRAEEPTTGAEDAPGTLTVELPRDSLSEAALANLDRLIRGNGSLIRKAIGAESLAYEVTEDRIRFPWFTLTGNADEAAAYTQFIGKLAQQARTAKRVTLKEKAVENEKYAFRCFLLRLGFIGEEYKTARKILLRNLSGNASWKGGAVE